VIVLTVIIIIIIIIAQRKVSDSYDVTHSDAQATHTIPGGP